MEQQDQDASDEQTGDELADEILLIGLGEQVGGEEARVGEAAARAPNRAGAATARSRAPSTARRSGFISPVDRVGDPDGAERRQCERQAVQPWSTDAGGEEEDAEGEADDPSGVHRPVRTETAVAGKRAARRVSEVVGRERHEQCEQQQRLAVEQLVDEGGAKISDRSPTAPARIAPSRRSAFHERAATDPECSPVGERPADLLFEWLKEAGCDDEHDRPQPLSAAYSPSVS